MVHIHYGWNLTQGVVNIFSTLLGGLIVLAVTWNRENFGRIKVSINWDSINIIGHRSDNSIDSELGSISIKFSVYNPTLRTKSLRDFCIFFDNVEIKNFTISTAPDLYSSSDFLLNNINLGPSMVHVCSIFTHDIDFRVPVNSNVYLQYKLGRNKIKRILLGNFDGKIIRLSTKS